MKSIRSSIASLIITMVVAIFGIFTSDTIGATAPEVSPQVLKALGNPDEFRNFGLSLGRKGEIHVSSKSMDWDYPSIITSAEASGNYTEEILEKLSEKELSYRIMNPADEVNAYVYIYDEKDHIIFYGYVSYHLQDLKGGDRPKFQVWQYEMYLFSNVSSAEIIGVDDTTGESTRTIQRLTVKGGSVSLNQYIAGKENGILVVHFNDGSNLTIRLGNGTQEKGAAGGVLFGFEIRDHYALKDPSVVTITALQERPTVYLQITESKVVKFDVAGIYTAKASEAVVERPTKVIISTPDGVGVGEFDLKTDATLSFPKGNWRIRFVWKEFGDPGKFYFPTTDDGGGEG